MSQNPANYVATHHRSTNGEKSPSAMASEQQPHHQTPSKQQSKTPRSQPSSHRARRSGNKKRRTLLLSVRLINISSTSNDTSTWMYTKTLQRTTISTHINHSIYSTFIYIQFHYHSQLNLYN